jgi:acyl-CoA synthetase (AMP-forming)/AMP-acid ligase II
LDDEASKEGVHSLPDLIQFNADHNPDHLFAIQEVKLGQERHLERVTFLSLHHAVLACREWLAANFPVRGNKKPIGLLMESGLGLFIYLASLLSLESPVLLLSARLGPAAISHLVAKTGSVAILTSKRTESLASHATLGSPIKILNAPPLSDFLTSPSIRYAGQRLPRVPSHKDEPGMLILHSSGTTGLPKPVFLTHRYVLGYAACHRLHPEESVGRVNVSTLPLYHVCQ